MALLNVARFVIASLILSTMFLLQQIYGKTKTTTVFGSADDVTHEHKKMIPMSGVSSALPKDINLWNPYINAECVEDVSTEEAKTKQLSNTIKNLGDYVNQIGKHGCFILINNFQGINIPDLGNPAEIGRSCKQLFIPPFDG